jgi:ABC-type phosphate transport system substrate-binding protein
MERKPYATSAKTLNRYADIVEAIVRDNDGVGYTSMTMSEHKGVRAVRINSVAPTSLAVNEGLCPYSRGLRLFTNAKKESRAARDFIRFVQSKGGQKIISDLGFVRRFEQKLWVPEM